MEIERDHSWTASAVYWTAMAICMVLGGAVLSFTWNEFFAAPFGIAYRVGVAHAIGLTVGLRSALSVVRDTPSDLDDTPGNRAKRAVTTTAAFVIALVILHLAKWAM